MTTGKQLTIFTAYLRRAAKYGVEADYRKRFRKLRRESYAEVEAAELALRDAISAVNPRAKLGVTVTVREGKS